MFIAEQWHDKHIMKKYETDLTDEQWEIIAPLFVNMRKYKWEKRELVNAVLYLVKSPRSPQRFVGQSVKTTGAVEQKGFDMGKNERSKMSDSHR